MNNIRTLRLIDYKYDEDRDLIKWKVRDETPEEEVREYFLAWPGGDLASQFGIKTKLPAELIIKFSKDMKNRVDPFYMQNNSTVQARDKEWFDNASEEKLHTAHEEIDYLPFDKVCEQIEEENLKNKNT